MNEPFRSTDDLNDVFDVLGNDDGFPEFIDEHPHRLHVIEKPGDRQIEDEAPIRNDKVFPDEWDQTVERQEKAEFGPDGQPVDELVKEGQVKTAEYVELQELAPFTREAPPTAVMAVFGGQVAASTGPSLAGVVPDGPIVEVARWQGDTIECRPITVTFAKVAGPLAAGGQGVPEQSALVPRRPIGIVRFGNFGFMTTLLVDITGNGVQLVVTGSSIIVMVGMVGTTIAGLADGSLISENLVGMFSFRNTHRHTPVYKTVYFDPLGSGATVNTTVPAFATRVWFYRANPTTVGVSLLFIDSLGNTRYGVDIAAGAQLTSPIPLAGDIVQVRVVSTAGAASNASLVYELNT